MSLKKSCYRYLTEQGKRVIKIGFRTPGDYNAGCFNTVASWMTDNGSGQIFSHVEVRFSDGYVTSITETNNKIHYDNTRVLSADEYRSFFEIHVTAEQENIMQAYAEKAWKEEVPFNKCAMMWNFLPCLSFCAIRKKGTAFFCSEYITVLLQLIGYVPELDPSLTSPNDLHAALTTADNVYVSINEIDYMLRKQKMPDIFDVVIDAVVKTPKGKTGLKKK